MPIFPGRHEFGYRDYYSADPPEPRPPAPEQPPKPCRWAMACGAVCVYAEAAIDTRILQGCVPSAKTPAEMLQQAWDARIKLEAMRMEVGESPCGGCPVTIKLFEAVGPPDHAS